VHICGTASPDEARRYPGESAVSALGKQSAARVVGTLSRVSLSSLSCSNDSWSGLHVFNPVLVIVSVRVGPSLQARSGFKRVETGRTDLSAANVRGGPRTRAGIYG